MLAGQLRSRGVSVIELAAVRVVPRDDGALAGAIRELDVHDWLVFTSRAGVDAASRSVRANEVRARVAAVGPATAQRCAEWGVAGWMPSEPTGAALGRELPRTSGMVLLARADRAHPAIVHELRARGAAVREIAAYGVAAGVRDDAAAARDAALAGATVVFASPAACEAVIAAIGRDALARARILAIGPTTALAVRDATGVTPRIVRDLRADAIVREMEAEHVAHR